MIPRTWLAASFAAPVGLLAPLALLPAFGLVACSSSTPSEASGLRGEGDGSAGLDGSELKSEAGTSAAGEAGAPDAGGGATAVTVGLRHACALTPQGAVLCWGDNGDGQLGDGTTVQHATPALVIGLTQPIRAIAAGDQHTCALDSAGAVRCWGSNASGALGNGSSAAQSTTPALVTGLSGGVVAIAAGGSTTCAAMASGGAVCWGANSSGQIGDGSTMNRSAPSATTGVLGGVLAGATSLAPAGDHTCLIAAGGSVECSGDDTNGALGNGGNESVDTFVASGLMSDVVAVTASLAVTCALIDDGTVRCWGFGGDGELGNGISEASATPVPVIGLSGVTGLAAGLDHVCAVTGSGVSCWGDVTGADLTGGRVIGSTGGDGSDGSDGSGGDGSGSDGGEASVGSGPADAGDAGATSPLTAASVVGIPGGIKSVAAGGGTCAITAAGAVLCWGDNTYGELGDGTTTPRAAPVAVVGFP